MQTPWVYLDFIFPLSPNARLVRMNYKASLVRILYIGVFLGMALPFGVTADIIADPGSPDTFESLTSEGFYTLSLETETGPLASTIQVAEPLSIQYTIGYSNKFEQHYGTTPEERTEILQTHLEDSKTYLELWKGEPFTPDAVPVQSFELSSALTGSISLEASEPGPHFLVFYFTNEVRDEAAFCVRYEVPSEDCLADWYFTRFPHEETQEYFRTPLGSYQITPDAYPISLNGTRLEVLPAGPAGISSVLFLPGIKGSRLYRHSDNCNPDITLECPGVRLWEPVSNMLLEDLFLTESGKSYRHDVYVREDDIMSEALGIHFYSSFVNQMDALKADGVFADWKAVPYDWRLSLDEIIAGGQKRGSRVYFSESTDTPYIEQTLRDLAAESATGKVSIIAHSNGGLVAKRLMQQLELEGAADLVDKIILVGVPQSGAPQAIGSLLYGHGEALPFDQCSTLPVIGNLCSSLVSRATARTLAEQSPMAHHLLPSQAYFDQVLDSVHTVAKFSALNQYTEERSAYGTDIDSIDELHSFLTANDGGRTKPQPTDIASANVLSTTLLSYGRNAHQTIDSWTPPEGIEVHQIAGWGMPTISGIEFYEQRKLFGGYREMYRPVFVEDGDGVVPVPSALMASMSLGDVHNYWIDLKAARENIKFDHGNIFELTNTRVLIRNLLLGIDSDLQFISSTQPEPDGGARLLFFLHSPLSLELYDSQGRHVGEAVDGTIDSEIPGAEYGVFGEVQYLIAPADNDYQVRLNGKDSGTFSLDIQQMSGDAIESFVTFSEIPTTANTAANLNVSGDLSSIGSLEVDTDGDGQIDIELAPVLNESVTVTQAPSKETNNPSTNQKPRSSTPVTQTLETQETEPPLDTQILEVSHVEETEVASQQTVETELPELNLHQPSTTSLSREMHNSLMHSLVQLLYNLWQSIIRFLMTSFS